VRRERSRRRARGRWCGSSRRALAAATAAVTTVATVTTIAAVGTLAATTLVGIIATCGARVRQDLLAQLLEPRLLRAIDLVEDRAHVDPRGAQLVDDLDRIAAGEPEVSERVRSPRLLEL